MAPKLRLDALPTGLRYPGILLVISLVVLLCASNIHVPSLFAARLPRRLQDSQLQEIASLMEDIYFTLSNMTFIPSTAIKQGPHRIDTTAIACERDGAALRLMEIMPYVEKIELRETDEACRMNWLFGGEFIDYRKPHHLGDGCDPIHSGSTWYDLNPTTIALTRWGNSGWNDNRAWVLLYNIERHAISIYQGEDFIALHDEDNPEKGRDSDYTGIGIFGHSTKNPLAILPKDDHEWQVWFDAPTLLTRIRDAYQSLAWTPWETSNKEEELGVHAIVIGELMGKSGWPDAFNADQFNADFIRAQHAHSRHGPAEATYKIIKDLEGRVTDLDYKKIGAIARQKKEIANLEAKLPDQFDEQEYWLCVFRIQSKKWTLQDLEAKLAAAKLQIQRLCPDGVCVEDENLILWELHSLEKEYESAKRTTTIEKQCDWDLRPLSSWAPPPPEQIQKCVAKRRREAYWLELAYNQTKAEALRTHSSSSLIPQPSLEERVRFKIAEFEDEIVQDQVRAEKMYDWLSTLPAYATKARTFFEMEASGVANRPWSIRERIEWMEEMLEGHGNRMKLWRCMDDPDCL